MPEKQSQSGPWTFLQRDMSAENSLLKLLGKYFSHLL